MVACSPFLRELPLSKHGLNWAFPPAPLAHPLDDGSAVMLHHSIDETARSLNAKGGGDGDGYRRFMGDLVARWQDLLGDVFAPPGIPEAPGFLCQVRLAGDSSGNVAGARVLQNRAWTSIVCRISGAFHPAIWKNSLHRQWRWCWLSPAMPQDGLLRGEARSSLRLR